MEKFEHSINIVNAEQQQTGYLTCAYNSCIDFQQKIRRSGVKTFSVWKYLEECFANNWKSRFRKPPRANTILHWFETDPVTGMKMGADDLADICLYVNDYTPLIMYHEEKISRFENVSIEPSINDKQKIEIKDSALELADHVGDLCGEVKSALQDGKFQPHEKKDVVKAIALLKNKIKNLEGLVK